MKRKIRGPLSRLGLGTAVIGALFGVSVAAAFLYLYLALPELDGSKTIPELSAAVQIESDDYGVPTIRAGNRNDAFRALGFVVARDRLFQLELLRRAAQGRLAEIFGPALVGIDKRQRIYGYAGVARRILQRLPRAQKNLLAAYSQGINAYLEQSSLQPFEFALLGIEAAPWQPTDSILVALNLFQALNFTGHKEAMLSVMAQCVPDEVASFLTPDSDQYTETLTGGPAGRGQPASIPVLALKALYSQAHQLDHANSIRWQQPTASNGWVVNARKTRHGQAILANDLHLPLMLPNIWYRARMRYPDTDFSGIVLPGVPLLVSGSTRHLAWGFTNSLADVIDLITLELNPQNPQEYLSPQGWKVFTTRTERIVVRGGETITLRVRATQWGPVSEHRLAGKLTAIHWTALDPKAVDLALIDLDNAQNLDQAAAIFRRAGAPSLNVMLAAADGSIGWTLTGKIPRRQGFDGSISRSWAAPEFSWQGYLQPQEIPVVKDPKAGFLVTANNRVIGSHFRYPIGRNFANGYRAWRIRQQMESTPLVDEASMFRLQTDTRAEFYDFYRNLALSVLSKDQIKQNPDFRRIRRALRAWDGHADADSLGFALLFKFRRKLAGEIILPLLHSCYDLDDRFYYSWFNMDTPLRELLTHRPAAVLPQPERFMDWQDLILKVLVKTARALEQQYRSPDIGRLAWGEFNAVRISHPFSRALPVLGKFLDTPDFRYSGCTFCINVMAKSYGASNRLVVSPANPGAGYLQMPGGQSGHPMSRHYLDQQPFWANLQAMPLVPGPTRHRLVLVPKPTTAGSTKQD